MQTPVIKKEEHDMAKDLTLNTLSIQNVIDAYKRYGASEKVKEPILYFISELTRLSIDTLFESIN